jgi:hypothetical protein
MSVTLQEVLKTDTLEIQRQKFNTLALDTFNVLAGGTNLSAGTVGISDGTLASPALYFNAEQTLGLYRANDYKLAYAVDNNLVMSVGDHEYNSLVGVSNPTVNVYRNLNTFSDNAITGFTFTGGSGYVEGSYLSIPLTTLSGTGGNGASANFTISGLVGSATSLGSGYIPGSYSNIAFTNQSRPVSTFTGSITGTGVGYTDATYQNVPLTGGVGTGAEATIVISGLTFQVDSVTITSFGDGLYEVGDVLSADDANLGAGGGSGFAYAIDSVVSSAAGATVNLTIDESSFAYYNPSGTGTPQGTGYTPGTYQDVPLTGGNGTGLEATLIVTGGQSVSGNITSAGSGYTDDTYTGIETFNEPTATYAVTVFVDNTSNPPAMYYELDGNAQPAFSLVPGNTYRFDVSDSTNSGHILQFQGSGGLTPPPTGVTIQKKGSDGTAGAFIDVVINASVATTETFEYYCTNHAGMGNTITLTTGSTGNYGVGAVADVTIVANAVSSFVITNIINASYQTNTVLNISDLDVGAGGGSGFAYTIGSVSTSGAISGVNITDSGTGYVIGDILSVNNADVGGIGSGFEIEVTSLPAISSAVVATSGTGYLVGDVLSINNADVGNSGSGFEFTISNSGSITDVILTNAGGGYGTDSVLEVNNTLLGGSGSGFTLNVNAVAVARSSTLTPDGNAYFAGSVGLGIDFDNDLPLSYSLEVKGTSEFSSDLKFNSQTLAPADTTSNTPSYSFAGKTTCGMFSSGSNKNLILTGGGGSSILINEGTVTSLKTTNFQVSEIDTVTLLGGSSYTMGVYTSVPLVGGTGGGATADVTIGFIGSISDGGTNYGSEFEYNDVGITGGSGTGGRAKISVDATGAISSFIVVDPGDANYIVGDAVSVDPLDLVDGNGGAGLNFSLTITKINLATLATLKNRGSSYSVNDILAPSETNTVLGSAGFGFGLIVSAISETILGKFEFSNDPSNDIYQGELDALSIRVSGTRGLFVGGYQDLHLTSSTVKKLTTGNLEVGAADGLTIISGGGALVVPSGSQGDRPSPAPPAGSIRFNTTSQSYEAYDGANWGSLGGTRDVDGNTYILPESSPGANENILFFYNNAKNTLDVEETKIKLYNATNIESVATSATNENIVEWQASLAVTIQDANLNQNYVYYGLNLYSVDTDGNLDATTPPTHGTGTVTNGTVDLTYYSSIYTGLNVTASSVGLNVDDGLSINSTLDINSDATSSILGGSTNNLQIGVGGSLVTNPEYSLLNISNAGAVQINTGFGSSETYTTLVDSGLRLFNLKDVSLISSKSTLTKGTSNSANFVLYDPALYSGSKVTILADNITTGDKEIIEMSVIDTGSDIYNIEVGDVYTSASKIIDVELNYNSSNDVRLTYLLDGSVATADNVIVTVISNRITK